MRIYLLLKPQPAESTRLVIKQLKEETANRILKTLRATCPFGTSQTSKDGGLRQPANWREEGFQSVFRFVAL
jgi:hypothetical protein